MNWLKSCGLENIKKWLNRAHCVKTKRVRTGTLWVERMKDLAEQMWLREYQKWEKSAKIVHIM